MGIYAAILNSYTKDALLTLIEALNPSPRGIVVGGGFQPEDAQAVEQTVEEWAANNDERKKMKVVAVPPGTLERRGPAGVVSLIQDELGKVFDVFWES